MVKGKSIRLAGIREGVLVEVAARIYGCQVKDLLSWSEKDDGSVVIIAPTGQKFTYSAEEIVRAVPRVAVLHCAGTGAVIRDEEVAKVEEVTEVAEEVEEPEEPKEPKEPEGPEEPEEVAKVEEVEEVTEMTKEEEEPEESEEPEGPKEPIEMRGGGGVQKRKPVARKRGRRAGAK